MERLELRYRDALKSLSTLELILQETFSVIVRDAAIQRFEYTFEAVWKFLKEYLKEKEGIISHSPKSCFKEIFGLGFSSEKDTVSFLEMTDRRNQIVHTYKEEVARIIYSQIESYYLLMSNLLSKFDGKV